jgi:hypothetical protein
VTSAEFAPFWGELCFALALWNLTQAGFFVFGEGPDTLFAASVFGFEPFLSGSTSGSFFAIFLSLFLLAYEIILGSAASTCTSLAAFITDGFFSFGPGDNADARLVGAFEVNAGVAAVLVIKFFGFGFGVLVIALVERLVGLVGVGLVFGSLLPEVVVVEGVHALGLNK